MNAEVLTAAARLSSICDAWLTSNTALFNPLTGRTARERSLRRKAFVELSLAVSLADRLSSAEPLASLRAHIIDVVNDRHFADLLQRNRRLFELYAFPIIYGHSLGQLDRRVASIARDVLAGRLLWAVEDPMFKPIALWHFCRALGVEPRISDVSRLTSLTLAARPPDCMELTLGDGYTLTHDVFYLSDFGFSTPLIPLESLATLLPLLLLRVVADGHLDLGLELAASAAMLRQLPDVVADFIISTAEEDYERHGVLRAPDAGLIQDLIRGGASLPPESPNYHTMLVGSYAMRMIADRYAAPAACAVRLTADRRSLSMLGQAASALGKYRLLDGALRLQELAGSQLRAEWPAAFADLASFLSRQRHPDGTYGSFLDEELDAAARGDAQNPALAAATAHLTNSACEQALTMLGAPV